jgi:hypothetical protein
LIKNILADFSGGLLMVAPMRALSIPLALLAAALFLPAPCSRAGVALQLPVASGMSHEPFDALLQTHLDPQGRLQYDAWRKKTTALAALDHYLDSFDPHEGPIAEGREQMAAWINLYHACLIRDILRQPGLGSPKGDRGFFTEKRHRVGARSFSLADLSETHIVPILGWRARGVLHLGCYGGPPLPPRALDAHSLDVRIDSNWKNWLASPDHFQASAERILLPQIFLWHRSEFEIDGGFREVLVRYLPPESATWVTRKDLRVEYLPFDWTLCASGRAPDTYPLGRMLRDRWWPW